MNQLNPSNMTKTTPVAPPSAKATLPLRRAKHTIPVMPVMQQQEVFLQMLQGPTFTILVGSGAGLRDFTLPGALLRFHSIFLAEEIDRLTKNTATAHANKKRKLNPDGDATVDAASSAEQTSREDERADKIIRLPDINSAIFGLFIKYMYANHYPEDVDIVVTRPHYAANVPAPRLPQPQVPAPDAVRPIPQQQARGPQIYNRSFMPPQASNSHQFHAPQQAPTGPQPSMPPPTTPPNPVQYLHFIPVSIQTWLLAQHLGALGLMNYALSRIYVVLGKQIILTPYIVDYIWKATDVRLNTSSSSSGGKEMANHATQGFSPEEATSRASKPNTVLSPSPLRRFILDVLISYWPAQNTPFVAKAPGLVASWNAVFDRHVDLRQAFISGLQGGGRVMQGPGQYYALTAVAFGKLVEEKEKEKEKKKEVGEELVKDGGVETKKMGEAGKDGGVTIKVETDEDDDVVVVDKEVE